MLEPLVWLSMYIFARYPIICMIYVLISFQSQELSTSLCHFDKRTIELLLARADLHDPPSHLSDLRIASLMETSGRERRHRYFTVANYRKLVAQEELDRTSAGYDYIDLKDVGGFLPTSGHLFYAKDAEMIQYCDGFKKNDKSRVSKARKKQPKNPILPDGKIKRGRPRKTTIKDNDEVAPEMSTSQVPKRKRDDMQDNSQGVTTELVEEPKKKKGRPSKKPLEGTPGTLKPISTQPNLTIANKQLNPLNEGEAGREHL